MGSAYNKESKESRQQIRRGIRMKKVNKNVLKEGGLIIQSDPDYYAIRLKMPSGRITPDQLRKVAEVAEKEGRGHAHISSRQGIEIPWIPMEKMFDVVEDLAKSDLYAGSCGPRIRNVTACPGSETCPFAQIETQELGIKISEKYVGKKAHHKFKISVSGCTNFCSNPLINDIGIIGRVRPKLFPDRCNGCGICVRVCRTSSIKLEDNDMPVIDYDSCIDCGFCVQHCPVNAIEKEEEGYSIYVGGKMGKVPHIGKEIIRFATEEELFEIIEQILSYYREFGNVQERFTEVLARNGLHHLEDYVLKK